jgi:hypothetical protein
MQPEGIGFTKIHVRGGGEHTVLLRILLDFSTSLGKNVNENISHPVFCFTWDLWGKQINHYRYCFIELYGIIK